VGREPLAVVVLPHHQAVPKVLELGLLALDKGNGKLRFDHHATWL
jgi:hypothetical protein